MNNIIVVRGAGDIATAVICKLYKCGYKVVALEKEKPLAIRRQVSLSEAAYVNEYEVDGVCCKLAKNTEEVYKNIEDNKVSLLIDPEGVNIDKIVPAVVIDCILAKKNLGTNKNMANLTIGLGPGFCAGKDVDFVIETMRGHNLGRIISNGEALRNTGIPGEINGVSKDRVGYSNCNGIIRNVRKIGDIVSKGDILCYVDSDEEQKEIVASIDGLLRGLIRDGSKVWEKLKILDIDPRKDELENCFTISDKARCIAGSVLEVILSKGILPR